MPANRVEHTWRTQLSKMLAPACLVFVATCSCGEEEPEQTHWQYPDSLLGTWVRVYPAPAGTDTVRIGPNGVASGPKTAVSATEIERITRWGIGWIDPRHVCFRDDRVGECSGYQLRGDTLALAIPTQTVLIRAEALWLDAALLDSTERGDRARWGDSAQILKAPGRQ